MNRDNIVIYDLEIINAIPPSDKSLMEPGISYCAGWHDHENMGISCVCTYSFAYDRYRVFLKDNMETLREAMTSPHTIWCGFNNINFDNPVLAANGLVFHPNARHLDLLREIWIGLGLDPEVFTADTHGSYGLDAMAQANGLGRKTGHGATAPVDWQKGQYGKVIDYSLKDVHLTHALFQEAYTYHARRLASPKGGQIPLRNLQTAVRTSSRK